MNTAGSKCRFTGTVQEKKMKTVLVGFASSSPGQANNGEHCSYLGLETKFLSSFYMVTSGGRLSRGRSTTARISRRFRCPPRELTRRLNQVLRKAAAGPTSYASKTRKVQKKFSFTVRKIGEPSSKTTNMKPLGTTKPLRCAAIDLKQSG